ATCCLAQQGSSTKPPAASVNHLQQLFLQGETALRAGNLDAAEHNFRQVIAHNAQMAGAYANLGVIAMRRQQWSTALSLLKKAQHLAPEVTGIRLNIGLVYFRQNNFKEAIAPFESVVKAQPDAVQPRYLLGLCYFFID